MKAYRELQCKGVEYDQARCSLSSNAVYKQKKSQVNYYLENRGTLVSVFNTCQAKYEKLREAKQLAQARKAVATFDCRMAENAAAKLKVYGFSSPIKL